MPDRIGYPVIAGLTGNLVYSINEAGYAKDKLWLVKTILLSTVIIIFLLNSLQWT